MSMQGGHCMGARLESFALLLLVGCSAMQRGFVGALDPGSKKTRTRNRKGL